MKTESDRPKGGKRPADEMRSRLVQMLEAVSESQVTISELAIRFKKTEQTVRTDIDRIRQLLGSSILIVTRGMVRLNKDRFEKMSHPMWRARKAAAGYVAHNFLNTHCRIAITGGRQMYEVVHAMVQIGGLVEQSIITNGYHLIDLLNKLPPSRSRIFSTGGELDIPNGRYLGPETDSAFGNWNADFNVLSASSVSWTDGVRIYGGEKLAYHKSMLFPRFEGTKVIIVVDHSKIGAPAAAYPVTTFDELDSRGIDWVVVTDQLVRCGDETDEMYGKFCERYQHQKALFPTTRFLEAGEEYADMVA